MDGLSDNIKKNLYRFFFHISNFTLMVTMVSNKPHRMKTNILNM